MEEGGETQKGENLGPAQKKKEKAFCGGIAKMAGRKGEALLQKSDKRKTAPPRGGGDDASVQAIREKKGASVAVAFQPILPADGGIGRRGKGFRKVGGQTFLDVYMGNFFC